MPECVARVLTRKHAVTRAACVGSDSLIRDVLRVNADSSLGADLFTVATVEQAVGEHKTVHTLECAFHWVVKFFRQPPFQPRPFVQARSLIEWLEWQSTPLWLLVLVVLAMRNAKETAPLES